MRLKNIILLYLTNPLHAAALVMAIPAALLAAAFLFQYGFGLAPCVLCLYQRWPYAAIILIGWGAFMLACRNNPKAAAGLIFVCTLIFLGESALAIYHVGVEQHWWVSAFEGCSTGFDMTDGSLLERIQNTPAVRCDAVAWSLFGISMAGYNALIALGMAVYTALASIMITRKANGF